MTRSWFAVPALSLLLVACGGGSSGGGNEKSSANFTEVSQCPSVKVVSCVHKDVNTASGIPNDVSSDDCIEVHSDGTAFGDAQVKQVMQSCDPANNTPQVTYTLGTGCPHGDLKQGCLAGSELAGYCQIQWVLMDDPTKAADWAAACTAGNLSPVSP